MAYFDPSNWIEKNDCLLPDVEYKVEMEKLAKSDIRSPGFVPANYNDIRILVKENGEILSLLEWHDRTGKINIVLKTSNNIILRQGHFNRTKIHHNPGGKPIPPPHHIHFPTMKDPDLNRRPAYAYPVTCGTTYTAALTCYCNACNIKLDGIPMQFIDKGKS